MPAKETKTQTVDEYIESAPLGVQPRLREMRQLVLKHVPAETVEKISWGMPTYQLHSDLVHFAAQKAHMGFYPGASGVQHFQEELQDYHTTKGAIQIPYNQPLPVSLIQKIIAFRIAENEKMYQEKSKKAKPSPKEVT